MDGGPPYLVWKCWDGRNTFPQKIARRATIIGKCGRKKQHGSSDLHCVIWNTPRVLCGAVQELCQCLAPLIEEDHLLKLEMVDVAEKGPVAPAPVYAPSSSTPDPEEEEQVIQIPREFCTLEAAHLEGCWDLIQGRYQAVPLAFGLSEVNPTHAGLVRGVPLGGFHALGSLQVTICLGLVVREMCYEYQSQVIILASLQLP